MAESRFEDYVRERRSPSRNGPRRNSDRSPRGNSDRFPRRDFRPRNSEERNSHTTKCDACGNTCEVPFKPTAGKPVYCDNCFKSNKNSGSGNSSKSLSEINEKLDKILALLEEN